MYNAPINGLPQDGEGGGIRLIEVHMGREFDILIEHPQDGKFDSATILESGGPGNNNNNTYIALIRMRSKRFTSIVLQYDLEI